MNEKIMFAERLKSSMHKAGYDTRPSVLEREFNLRYWGKPITFQAVRRWLRGDSIPSQDKLQVLACWLSVTPHYLRYGGQEIHAAGEPECQRDTPLTSEERHLLALYKALPQPQRKIVHEVLETFAKAHGTPPTSADRE